MTGADSVSDWSIGMTSGEPGIFLASPIRGQFGEIAGVLVIKLETSPIDALLYRTAADRTAEESAQIDATRQFADEPPPSLGPPGLREDFAGVAPGTTSISSSPMRSTAPDGTADGSR